MENQVEQNYVISRENVGPNAMPLNKIVIIQDHPGTTNQSGEEKISGWLGTTNGCYESAHGEFPSLADAQKYVQKTWPGVSLLEEYEREPGEIEAYQDTREVWAIDDYAYDYARENISASTTDDEIKKLAAEVESEAKKNSIYIDGDVGKFFSEYRKELIEDESTELEKLPQEIESAILAEANRANVWHPWDTNPDTAKIIDYTSVRLVSTDESSRLWEEWHPKKHGEIENYAWAEIGCDADTAEVIAWEVSE